MKMMYRQSRKAQRGIVGVISVVFLIAVVLFILTQTFKNSASASIDNNLQRESISALYLAESGLELAQTKISIAAWGTFDSSTLCIGNAPCILPSGSQNLGSGTQGTFTYTSLTIPASCKGVYSTYPTPCTPVMIGVKGTVGNANREISQIFNIPSSLTPAFCNTLRTPNCSNQSANLASIPAVPAIWSLTLPRFTSSTLAGVGVFNLGAAGNVNCLTSGLGCLAAGTKRWELSASSSVLGLGNTVVQTGADQIVFQRLSANADTALSGALFPGMGTPASVVGAYQNALATGSTGLTGQTSNGGAPLQWCDDSQEVNGTNMALVLGLSARTSNAKTAQVGSVFFDTRGVAGAGVPLTRLANPSNTPITSPRTTDTKAADTVYSGIFYKLNPAYSYGRWMTGQIKASPLILDIQPTNKTMYGVLKSDVVGIIGIGDVIDQSSCTSKAIPAGATVTGFNDDGTATTCDPALTGPFNGRPNGSLLCFSLPAINNANCHSGTVSGSDVRLEVSTMMDAATNLLDLDTGLGVGQTVAGPGFPSGVNVRISTRLTPPDTGFIGTYRLSAATPKFSTDTTMVVGGATVSGATISLNNISPAINLLPSSAPSYPVVAVRSISGFSSTDTGRLSSNTSVTGAATNSLSLSAAAAINTGIPNSAVICGGSCALFDQASTLPGGNTMFQIGSVLPTGTSNWAAGLVCLKNADVPTALQGGVGPLVNIGTWTELIH